MADDVRRTISDDLNLAVAYLVGKVMLWTKGEANAQEVADTFKERLTPFAHEIERLRAAIQRHREYVHDARDRWPSNGGQSAVQVTSGDIELWAHVGPESYPEPTTFPAEVKEGRS